MSPIEGAALAAAVIYAAWEFPQLMTRRQMDRARIRAGLPRWSPSWSRFRWCGNAKCRRRRMLLEKAWGAHCAILHRPVEFAAGDYPDAREERERVKP